ncbi:copper homeostasis protein CutC [Marinoscillum furvescens]|uniref:PF03932 family protein CutC n=1 Tax=Marinoscillum furvescens DSM 4134 TaxID=1122208 RepID=A0A3D9L4C3_MARFU|nr:copper homeostasis protein CutC [Marinoscillum furvescens]REE00465.1 copper homeostasis protein CutC [Marinoscillum furvescens DSM 4134]
MTKRLLEVCIDSVASAVAAEKGRADRVELCANLVEGGTTPSAGMIQAVRSAITIDLQVMIRPRGGDFLYTPEELDVMKRDIQMAKDLGADGLVFGCLTADAEVDKLVLADLIGQSRPLNVTFHRAFDMVQDWKKALEDLIDLGVDRVLTSGLAPDVIEGAVTLANIVSHAQGRIAILPGGGVRDYNIRELLQRTGASEAHVSGRKIVDSQMKYRNANIHMGALQDAEYCTKVTDEKMISTFRKLLDS